MTATVVSTSPGFGRAGDLPQRLAKAGWMLIRVTGEDIAEVLPDADFLVASQPAPSTPPHSRCHDDPTSL